MTRKRSPVNAAPAPRLISTVAPLSEWFFVRRPGPFYVSEPEPMRPDVLLLAEAATGLVADTQVLSPSAPMSEAAEWAARALKEKRPAPFRPPRQLRVEGGALAAAVRARVGPEIPVIEGPVLEADEMFLSMAQMSAGAGDEAPASHLEGGRVPAAAVGPFFEAAARLFRMAPWEVATDSQAVQIDAPGFGRPRACACIIGALGENLGVIVFESLADYVAFTRLSDDTPQERARRRGAGVALFSINYERRSGVPRELRREAKAQGWRVAGPGAFPVLMPIEPDGIVRPLVEADYRFATACLEVLGRFYEKHSRLFERVGPKPVTEAYRLESPAGRSTVRVTAPHPDASWTWGSEEALDPVHRDDAGAQLAEFVTALGAAGRPEAWISGAEAEVGQFLAFLTDQGRAARGISGADVREYLMEFLPRRVDVPEDQVELVPDYLSEYFRWLGDAGREAAGRVRDVRDEIERRREAFTREARNPARWGPAKTVASHARRAGVDLGDPEQAGRFIEEFNERLREDPSLLRPDLGSASAPPRPKRWTWTPGDPPPDMQGPCPCGSGRRYKTCCRPR
jgi:hypothetical protein